MSRPAVGAFGSSQVELFKCLTWRSSEGRRGKELDMLIGLMGGGLRYISSPRNPSHDVGKHTFTQVREVLTLTKRTLTVKAS